MRRNENICDRSKVKPLLHNTTWVCGTDTCTLTYFFLFPGIKRHTRSCTILHNQSISTLLIFSRLIKWLGDGVGKAEKGLSYAFLWNISTPCGFIIPKKRILGSNDISTAIGMMTLHKSQFPFHMHYFTHILCYAIPIERGFMMITFIEHDTSQMALLELLFIQPCTPLTAGWGEAKP